MSRVSVISLKGGVGKTSVLLGLAGAACERGLRTLVIDLDPQANATTALDPLPFNFTVNDVLADGRPGVARDAIVRSRWSGSLDLIPAERALERRNTEDGPRSISRLRTALDGVDYPLVLIDCPPSLGELTRNGLVAADRALVVTEPGFFALQAAAQALDAVSVIRRAYNPSLQSAGIVVNRVRSGLAEHRFRLAELRDAFGSEVLDPVIPERSGIAAAHGACVPVQRMRVAGARAMFNSLLDQVTTGKDRS